ncbi:uncharacterized protein TRIADDRAFT_59762 [Trichoplax adhaerens]|uniref:MutL C-terminal dimerisation domain-containing protein n=1 Tax=Trichoplax adhaerens TaxID=10228 RepID=B3S6D0_TRIAD|nr:hypothetical protein TRIADDRAFT_59762 [Trichoplax adhaerens]EDV21601.1 hypothetical protein TRIADDRAFT_59762 [Trichoplax adhaerens]|eukprot:XP_002115749.1 hypothetical protein TRIADDRAFT_59762 [Trichoplax adhaerens]
MDLESRIKRKPKIQKLDEDSRNQIASQLCINTFSQCIEELVLNSIDAKSTHILIAVDPNRLNVEVCDNGDGIDSENLRFVGLRHYTSKYVTRANLQAPHSIGYRGEAVASICSIAKIVEVQTRSITSRNTYTKKFVNGLSISDEPTVAEKSRNYIGTTVTLTDIFYSLPVRYHRTTTMWDRERHIIKQKLEALAIIYYQITIILKNQVNGVILLKSHECCNLAASIQCLYGITIKRTLQKMDFNSDNFQLSGYIDTIHSDNNYNRYPQYIYLNGRLMHKNVIYDELNHTLLVIFKLINRHRKKMMTPNHSSNCPQIARLSRLSDCYMYIIHIVCPISEYVVLETSSNKIQFIRQDIVLSGIKKLCYQYFTQNWWMTPEELHYFEKRIYTPLTSRLTKRPKLTKDSCEITAINGNKQSSYKGNITSNKDTPNILLEHMKSDTVRRQCLSRDTITPWNAKTSIKSHFQNLQYDCYKQTKSYSEKKILKLNQIPREKILQKFISTDLAGKADIICAQNDENSLYQYKDSSNKKFIISPSSNKNISHLILSQNARAKCLKTLRFKRKIISPTKNVNAIPQARPLTKNLMKTNGIANSNVRSSYKIKRSHILYQSQMANYNLSQQNSGSATSRLSAFKEFTSATIALKLTSSTLDNCQVIGQVDNKFIACVIKGYINYIAPYFRHLAGDNKENYLVLIDQHAADERIRLEKLLTDYCQKPEEGLLSVNVRPPIAHITSHNIFSAIHNSRDSLRRLGIQFLSKFDGKTTEILSVPKLLIPSGVLDKQKLKVSDIKTIDSKAVDIGLLKVGKINDMPLYFKGFK